MHRNIYGLHAPMRQLMERKLVSYVGLELHSLAQ
jgi:Proteasome maturation factor UMP1